MQQMTDTLRAAIRSRYQVPIAKIEIYGADGQLEDELHQIISSDIDTAGSRKVLRTFSATLDNADGSLTPDLTIYDENVLWYNKTIKIFYGYKTAAGEEYLAQGKYTLDSIKPDITPDGSVVEISGQDLISRLIEDKFDDIYKIKDDLATESGNYAMSALGASATASSSITGFFPSQAIDSDVYTTHWKASAEDETPTFTLDMGAAKTINCFYTYWGSHSFDFEKRVHYYLMYSSDGSSWQRITDLNGLDEDSSLFGNVEHVFDPISCRYVRIMIVDWTGDLMLRHLKAQNINAVETVDKAIRDIALSAGITDVRIPITRRWIKQKQAEIGEEKLKLMTDLATSIGWKAPYMDEDGFLTTHQKDINPVDPVWTFDVDTDNIFSFSPRFSNDIYNVIVAVYKSSSEKAIVGRAIDNDPASPTSVQRLGRRVKKYENDLIDTQDKADEFASQKLFERTRFKHQTSIPVTGHPAIQPDDVVAVRVPEAKIDLVKYSITGYKTTFDVEATTFDTDINISEL